MEKSKVEKFIKTNYIFGEEIKKIIENENDINEKLSLIQFLSSFYWSNVCGKYSDNFIENILNKIGSSLVVPRDLINKHTILHVTSQLYEGGGHTRIIYNWIRYDTQHIHSLVITRTINTIPLWLKEAVIKNGGEIIVLAEDEPIKNAQQLLNIAAAFEKIVLHTHPNDIVPVIAFSADIKTPIYYLNHADHVFWLGVSITDLLLDLTSAGKTMSLKKRGVLQSEVLHIPIESDSIKEVSSNILDKKNFLENLGLSGNYKIIMSMASDTKFSDKPPYDFLSFSKLAVKKFPNTIFIIIGADPNSERWVNTYHLSDQKVIPIGQRSKKEVAKILPLADVYVDSFAFNSATCILEAISCGLPCVSLKTAFSIPDSIAFIQSNTQEEMFEKIGLYLNDKSYFNREKVLENLRKSNFHNGWSKNLKKIYSNVLTHKVKTFENKNIIIGDYEKYFYNIINKGGINYRTELLENLTLKNCFKILELASSLYSTLITQLSESMDTDRELSDTIKTAESRSIF